MVLPRFPFPLDGLVDGQVDEGVVDSPLAAAWAWMRANVPLPAKEASVEKRLVRVLAQNKAVEDGVLRVAQEEYTYRSLNLGTKMDLLVSYRNKTVVY